MINDLLHVFSIKTLFFFMLCVTLYLIKKTSFYIIDRWNIRSLELRLQYQTLVRQVISISFILIILILWGTSIKGFAFSIAAFAAAFVLATKELLQCVLGSMLKVSNNIFTVGDRVQVGSYRGIVIKQSFLGTTLMEVGPGETVHQLTGKHVFLPNSQYLSQAVKNESLGGEFVFHTFFIVLQRGDDWKLAEENVLKASEEICASFQVDAKNEVNALTLEKGLFTPSTTPKVSIDLSESEEIKLVVRLVCRVQEAHKIEQKVIRKYLRSMCQDESNETNQEIQT